MRFLRCSRNANKSAEGVLIPPLFFLSLISWHERLGSKLLLVSVIWAGFKVSTAVVHYPFHCDFLFSQNALVSSQAAIKAFIIHLCFRAASDSSIFYS